jgi:hypothetical protein
MNLAASDFYFYMNMGMSNIYEIVILRQSFLIKRIQHH